MTSVTSHVALVIVYNHRFDRNIEVLERVYEGRFSNIYHLVPFYTGTRPNVIPVYENSYYFQGYIAQGLSGYFGEQYEHFFFIADDLLLNPVINEHNYAEHLRLTPERSFLPGFITLHEVDSRWQRTVDAFEYRIAKPGVEAKNELPSCEDALAAFGRHKLDIKPLQFARAFRTPGDLRGRIRLLLKRLKHCVMGASYDLPYPLVGSYSDIAVVSSRSIRQFCHYCGVFAATDLFVELALPTSLVLSCREIVTEKDLSLQGKSLWTEEELKELTPFDYRLKTLLSSFPADYLYLHPIKLSKWDKGL
ncbi:MAG: hypothetical protein ABFE13_09405 [Phycisphaerales bacterium]